MLDPRERTVIDLPAGQTPLLMVVVDTEEEFDWSKPHDRAATAVTAIAAQERAHRIYNAHGLRPTYVVDYPVASQEGAFAPLRALLDAGRCEIGAHLHPWVNPPDDEDVTYRNSYPGNLPPALEREKLRRLTAVIAENFGIQPTVYRAGRYGVGPATAETLAALGYEVDLSVVPGTDLSHDQGPDFRHCDPRPYWFGRRDRAKDRGRLLEIPLSVGFTGLLGRHGASLHGFLAGPLGRRFRAAGIMARLGLLERHRLSPEGIGFDDHRRLTEALLARGQRIFGLTYHSPSLVPGHTPYVRDEGELDRFLASIERYCDYFMNTLGGRPTTPLEVKALIEDARL